MIILVPSISFAGSIESCTLVSGPCPDNYSIYDTNSSGAFVQCPNPNFAEYYCGNSQYINCNDNPWNPYSNPNAPSCTGHYSQQFLPSMQPVGDGTFVNCDVHPNDPACVNYCQANSCTDPTNPGDNNSTTLTTDDPSHPSTNNPGLLPTNNGHSGLGYVPLAPLPGIGDSPGTTTVSSLSGYLTGIFKLMIGLAAALAVIMIMIGGAQMMSTDSITGHDSGKEKIDNAIWGLVLAIAAWLILYTVNPALVNFNLNITPAPAIQTASSTIPEGASDTPATFINQVTEPGYYILLRFTRNGAPSHVWYGRLGRNQCFHIQALGVENFDTTRYFLPGDIATDLTCEAHSE